MWCSFSRPPWFRAALLGALGVGAFFAFAFFVYELALARVPQHRAALERLVRAQTGLDVHFNELGLRWGWYGPEAVFRRVELDRPGSTEVLLRAPELVVGFDAWRTLRSGQPEAGRIELLSPDIDLAGAQGAAARPGSGVSQESSGLSRLAILRRWRGGRVDIEGGTLRLPDPGGGANSFTLQIRRASLRRSDNEWSVFGLVFLPDRVGHTARIVLRVNGDLAKPEALDGSLKLEARRLLFPGCREFLAALPQLASHLPRGGQGDLTLDLDFEKGNIVKAGGNLRAAGLVFDGMGATPGSANLLVLDRLSGDWRVARHEAGWRIRIDSLELGAGEPTASLTVNTSDSGRFRGTLDRAPVASVLAVARWLTPDLDLAGAELNGTARGVTFDWDPLRADGDRLHTVARLEDVTWTPQSKDFTLSGFAVRVAGNENQLTADLQSRTARLELAQSKQYPLLDVQVSSSLRISNTPDGWEISTDEFALTHQAATVSLGGVVRSANRTPDGSPGPQIEASGTLTGADIPFVERLLGANTARAFGAAASRLTAGRIQHAEFHLNGPLSELPFGGHGDAFRGSLVLRDAVLSGGNLWPDAEGIDARVEWHGARIEASIEAGHAGAFQLASARAYWDAAGASATRLTGHINGRLEDAIAWVHDHPQLQEYTPDIQDVDASGNAAFDFAVSVPPDANGAEPKVAAKVSTFLDGARLLAVAGLPPMEGINGSFTFDAGRLQRSTLTGSWLGGPVTLHVGERHERAGRVFAVQAQGVLGAQQLADLANVMGAVQGNTEWTGELAYFPPNDSQAHRADPAASRWRIRADSSLLGVLSGLPEPFAKRPAVAVPVHIEIAGNDDTGVMRVDLGDRLRSSFALQKRTDAGWAIDRGAVRFGTTAATMPAERVVTVKGHLGQLDLPVYALAWQRIRRDSVPNIRAQIVADRMLVAGRNYGEVTLQAERTSAGTELQVDSAGIKGVARWPVVTDSVTTSRGAELHLARLDVPDTALPSDGLGLVAALAPTASISVEELNWRGRSLGRLSATVAAQRDVVVLDDVHLVNDTHDAHGTLRCGSDSATCQLSFTIDSTDAAATLEDFGMRPDLAATDASLSGDVEWRMAPEQSWLASLRGTLSMRLADGTVRGWQRPVGGDDAWPFALLAVPALVGGLDEPGSAGVPLERGRHELRFARLEADFALRDGQATTSNLHFDGDAEILMRGRTGLIARDYDQQVWVLRGEDRLPAAVRRFGATPRVAAAWLSLRELFTGAEAQDRSRAALRLQGSWDDPMVVAPN
jgi:uncharacterized protein YhdP